MTPKPERPPSTRAREPVLPEADTNRHAQSEPTDMTALIGFLLIGAAVLVIAGLGVGTWWLLFSGVPAHPQARWLPAECREFVCLNWAELTRHGLDQGPQELPGLALTRRCRVFLNNAELRPDDIERITAGQATDGSGLVVVYWLKHPVQPDALLAKPGLTLFKPAKKGSEPAEVIRGVPVYLYHDSALAFPEEHVILSGEAPLVRKILSRRSQSFGDSLNQLLGTLEFSTTSSKATAGVPESLRSTWMKQCSELTQSVRGTTDDYQYGPTIRFRRALHVNDDPSMWALQQCLQTSLAEAARAPQSSSAVRTLLKGVQVSASGGKVHLELTLPAGQLSGDQLEVLKSLLN